MIRDNITPPEAAVLEAESPLRISRMMDMLLSRNDFDPGRYEDVFREDHKRIEVQRKNAEQVSRQAQHARQHALWVIQRTNDLSDTIRRVRQ